MISAYRGRLAAINGRLGARPFSGYFFRQTRFLRELEFLVDGKEPFLCDVAETAPGRLEYTYVFPPVGMKPSGGSGSGGLESRHGIPERGLDVEAAYTLGAASLTATLRLTNRWAEEVSFELAWALSADYASLHEALAEERKQEAGVETHPEENGVRFRYLHEKLPFETRVKAEGGGRWEYGGGQLTARLSLKRHEAVEVRLQVRAEDFEEQIMENKALRMEGHLQKWLGSITQLHAPGETPLVEYTNRAMEELGSLALFEGPEDEWLAPAAGQPLYPFFFGRDSVTAAWQAASLDRGALLESVMAKLTRTQGTEVNDWYDEEPGRIIRQIKRDPITRLGETPHRHYYGDYAGPLMFVISLAQLYAWTGEKKLLERHYRAARRVLDWAREYGDLDGDGYLEYKTRSKKGAKHQGWKDSDNAVVYADGTQVELPIAPCEVQGYWFAALQLMALLSVAMGETDAAQELGKEAQDLKDRFNRDFWMEEEGFFAFGLDAEKKLIRSTVSNVGHCLAAGIIDDEKVERVASRLFQEDLFSGWGIRTLSTESPAYNPLAYHLGSVWPVENATILLGLRRYGFDGRVHELSRAIYDLARLWPGGRIPEAVGGYDRRERRYPGAYPRANRPQAWNQSAFPLIVQSLLGLQPVAALNLLAVDPILPPWLPELTLKNLRVGEAVVTMRFYRKQDGTSGYEVLDKAGTLHVVRQPPLRDLSAGLWERLGDLAGSALPF